MDRPRAGVRRPAADERYRRLVEQAADVVFTMAADGRCTFHNRRLEALTGRPMADAEGCHVGDLVAPEHRDRVWQQCRRALSGHDIATIEFDVPGLPAERRRSFEATVRRAADESGQPTLDVIARDVTSRNAREAAVRHQQRLDAVSRLAAGIAHDFNNLLAIILGQCEAAAPLADTTPGLREVHASVRTAAERAASLTGHLLVLSRRQVVQPTVLDLNRLVTASKPLLERLVGDDAELRLACAAARPAIHADDGQVRQLVANLVLHALGAMPEGGRITVSTEDVDLFDHTRFARGVLAPGAYVALAVSDTGAGRDAASVAWMFDPLFTPHARPDETGMGLATVDAVMRDAGGAVDVRSAPGAGTEVRLLFPRAAADARPVARPAVAGPARRATVMLVEDEPDLQAMLATALRRRGYVVLTAADALECIEACQQLDGPPDLLVTDVVLPGTGGRQLAETLRADFPGLPVLFISGFTDDAELMALVRQGGHFLQKPFSLRAFATRVAAILDRAQDSASPAD